MNREPVLYTFRHNTAYTRGFTWAASIVPRSPVIQRTCPACDAVEEYAEGAFDVILEGGTKYPDVLGCGAYPFLMVTEAVTETWREAGIDSFHEFPVGIAAIRSSKLNEVEPPRYCRIEIDGVCRVDLAGSGLTVVRFCSDCHHLVTRPPVATRYEMVPGSWDQSHLFRDPIHYPRVNFCSQLVVDLAGKHGFANFRFETMQGPIDPASKGLRYLRK